MTWYVEVIVLCIVIWVDDARLGLSDVVVEMFEDGCVVNLFGIGERFISGEGVIWIG